MRNLIIIGMLGAAAFMAGWFTINRDGENTIIEFNRAEIRNDTRRVIEKGREVLDRREQLNQQGYEQQVTQNYPPQQSFPGSTGQQTAQQPYDARGVGQPASYTQSAYPPPSYQQPVPNQPYQAQPYQAQPYPTQPTPYQGQATQYPPQPQAAYPRR